MTISIMGPVPADGDTSSQPVIYASVTCYGDVAETALADYRKAAEAAGSQTSDRAAGGAAYDVSNPTTSSTTTLFRVGGLVGQVADAGTATQADLAVVTSAVAAAMGDGTAAGTTSASPSDAANGGDPGASGPLGSDEPVESPFAPELEAIFPTSIADPTSTASPPAQITLSVQSASATDVFGDDPSSRALAARVRSLGSTMDALQVARGFDDAGALDLILTGFRVPNGDLAKLKAAIVDTWLSANAAGVKRTDITLGGKPVTKVDYDDGSAIEYVYAKADYVVVIETADAKIAEEIAAKLP
jgi:hypothetical protein